MALDSRALSHVSFRQRIVRACVALAVLAPLFVLAGSPAASAQVDAFSAIAYGDTWSYLDNGTNQGTAWRAPGFDDSSWATGASELGYGDGGEATIIGFGPDASNKYRTSYYRREFTAPAGVQSLTLNVVRDDGVVIYINGVQVASDNMPASFDYLTFATTPLGPVDGEATPVSFTLDPSVVQPGTNVIAAEIHQATTTSSDASFNLELTGTANSDTVAPSIPTGLNSPSATPTSVSLAWVGSTDNVAVQSYLIYRNGNQVGSTLHPVTTFTDTGRSPETTYTYTVAAVDGAGNQSAQSAAVDATTLEGQPEPIDVVINEVVAANDSYFDVYGDTPDWIEIQNNEATAINLQDWTIADNGAVWTFPSVPVAAGGRLLVFASGRDEITPQLHTNFSLKRGGETVSLADPSGTLVDSVTYPSLADDASYGVSSSGEVGVLLSATPLGVNTALAPSTVTITTPDQTFQNSLTVSMTAALRAGEQVRYTTNGNDVTASSAIYSGAFTISRSTVVRAAVVGSDGSVGPEQTAGYVEIASNVSTFSSDLPIVVVHADGAITSSVYQDAVVTVIDRGADGRASMTGPSDYSGFAGLRVRGASSSGFPKKQYKLELWNDRSGDERDADLLGLGSESDWGLYAPGRYDRAMINNPFMYELAKRTGVLAPDYQFVEVYLETDSNSPVDAGNYLGLFVLRETIKIDNERVDIVKHTSSTPGADGGYILRYDWNDNCCSNIVQTRFGSYVEIDSPKSGALTSEQFSYVSSWWTSLANAADTSFAAADAYIDFDSYIDHWLLAIMAMDIDVLRASHYMHKDAGGQLRGGPLWDFDRSLGSADTRADSIAEAQAWEPNGSSGHSYLSDVYSDLWQLPEVQARLRARWAELRAPGATLNDLELEALILSMGAEISEAYVREDAVWGSVSGYGSRFGDLNGELNHMRDWLTARTNWLDGQFLTTVAPPTLTLPPAGLQIQSNTLVNYQVQASDAQAIVYAATGLPKGLSIDPSTGVISGTVAYGDLYGTADVQITVTDSTGASTSGTLSISDPEFVEGAPSSVLLNEFNAVAPGTFLDDGGSDSTFGRVGGNGGDWFEIVTIDDNLDMRGWTFDLYSNDEAGASVLNASLELGQDSLLADIRGGTIITVAESVSDDLFYSPANNDWNLNLQANDDGDGALWESQSNFDTNNTRWRLVVRDATGVLRGYVAGETEPIVNAGASVGGGEVLNLVVDPSALATTYDDVTESTFGSPNVLPGGGVQDFSTVRPFVETINPGLILNEWNAVGSADLIDNGDTYFGNVAGNGGDWFELVVVEDNLDVRGWELEIRDADLGPVEVTDTFEFADDPLLANLRAGTIITVSEDLADDVSFLPATGDWWINLQAESGDAGAFFTPESQSNFNTNNDDWQLRIIDDAGITRFGPAGEGSAGVSGVSSTEIGRLEADPSSDITAASGYDDAKSSTFGAPNAPGDVAQDFSALRDWFVPDTTAPVTTIATPAAGAELTTANVQISGVATDETGVALVRASVQDTSTGLYLQTDGSLAAGAVLFEAVLVAPDAPSTGWSLDVVLPDGNYEVAAQAVDLVDIIEPFSTRSFSVALPDTEAPSVPADLAVTDTTSSTVALSWTAAVDNVGVVSYDVLRDGGVVGTVTAPTTSFTDTGLTLDTAYSYTVIAEDAAGNRSDASAATTATTAGDGQAPSSPTGLAVTDTTSSTVALSWTAAVDNVGVVSYQVLRDGSPAGSVSHPSTIFVDADLAAESSYTYEVVAIDAAGNESAASAAVVGTTDAAPVESGLSEISDPVWQTNGAVNAVVVVGDTIFIGGEFTEVTDGAGQTVARNRLAAIDRTTGAAIAFDPDMNNKVFAMTTSPDESTLYVVGSFTTAGGVIRKRVAAFDVATGALTSFKAPTPNKQVQAVSTDGARLYIGGLFTKVGGVERERLAAYDIATVTLDDTWTPSAGAAVNDVIVDGARVWVAGNFNTINGVAAKGLAAVDAVDGSLQATNHAPVSVFDIDVSGDQLFVAGNKRAMAFDRATGIAQWSYWTNTKLRSVDAADGFAYFGGNHTRIRGTDVAHLTRLDAANAALDTDWIPTIDGAKGVNALVVQDGRVFAGGDFTTVSGQSRVGFAAFSEGAVAPGAELVSLTMLDADANGFVDTVEAVFDKNLGACVAPCTAGWNLTAVPSAGTLTEVTVDGATATLVLAEGAGNPNTAVGGFTVALGAASELEDIDGTAIMFGATAPVDGAAPVVLKFRKTNAATTGLAEAGDTITTVWSEALLASSVPTVVDVVLTDPDDASNDQLTVDGYIDGAVDLGADDFLVCDDGPGLCDGAQAVFANSTIALSGGNKTVILTLAACTSGCDDVAVGTATTTLTYVAPASITDAVNNAAVGSVSKTFKMF